jgi:hypothetical protein
MIDFKIMKDLKPNIFFDGNEFRSCLKSGWLIFFHPDNFAKGRHGMDGCSALFIDHFTCS